MEVKTILKNNYDQIKKQISTACEISSRQFEDVTLIAVSKTKPVELIQKVYELGIRDFGENKVQELTDKYGQLPTDIRWHLIGHLQRNKVKYIIDKVFLIHSVDSIRLAEEISKEAIKHNLISNILIQVNIAEEESKFGATLQEAPDLIEQISKLPGISVKGLMTVAPFTEHPEENREVFYKLRELSVDIALKNIDNVNMGILSMGMSNDYEIAIEEGASHVRIGTSLFGERIYT